MILETKQLIGRKKFMNRHRKIQDVIKNALRKEGIPAELEVRRQRRIDVACRTSGATYSIEVDREENWNPLLKDEEEEKSAFPFGKRLKNIMKKKKEWNTTNLEKLVVENKEICSRATFYRYMNRFYQNGEIGREKYKGIIIPKF